MLIHTLKPFLKVSFAQVKYASFGIHLDDTTITNDRFFVRKQQKLGVLLCLYYLNKYMINMLCILTYKTH